MTTPNAETVISRLVRGGCVVSFELCSDGQEWLCRLKLRGHEVWNTGSDMQYALLMALLDLAGSLAQPEESEDP